MIIKIMIIIKMIIKNNNKRSSVKIAKHCYINDIIHRALVRAKIASVEMTVSLSRTDGQRPSVRESER